MKKQLKFKFVITSLDILLLFLHTLHHRCRTGYYILRYEQISQPLIDNLYSIFAANNSKMTINNVLELFDYMFSRIYSNNSDRWVEIPYKTLKTILGKNYKTILNKITHLIIINDKYSNNATNGNNFCKSYCFANDFIKLFNDISNWKSFVQYIQEINKGGVPIFEKKEKISYHTFPSNGTSSIMSPL